MALMINDNCIACDACLPACPNNAIFDKAQRGRGAGYHIGEGQESTIAST